MASFSFLQWCMVFILFGSALAQLSENFYSTSCPKALSIVRHKVKYAVKKEHRMDASLLRLQFHDCSVGGCDGSILLDDTKTSPSEKSALMNLNSARGFEVIDEVKARIEKACLGVVSCADILALVAQDSVFRLGGPRYKVPLGRRDSTETHRAMADALVPLFLSGLDAQFAAFESKGISKNEYVALTGAHTVAWQDVYPIENVFTRTRTSTPPTRRRCKKNCPKQGGDNNTAPIDYKTPFKFDNKYFVNLMKQRGLLSSDQALYTGKDGPADAIVANYSSSKENFFKDFVTSIIKFGQLGVLTGKNGEIRTNCRKANGANA